MKKIKLIVGVTRENNKGIKIANWIIKELQSFNTLHQYSILDLKEYNLPHYNEPSSPRGSKGYVHETTKRWSEAINDADAFIFITPEYNGFFTGALKDAIDYLYHEWENKPYTIIGYGSRGGKRAVKQLHLLLSSFNMKELETNFSVHKVWNAFNNEELLPEYIEGDILQVFQTFEDML